MQGAWSGTVPSKLPPGLKEYQQMECYGELGLVLNPNDPTGDRLELRRVLFDYLKYPSSDLARLHCQSDRLGSNDVVHTETNASGQTSITQEETLKVCPCCGFKQQPEAVPLCTNIHAISGMGSSTILLYEALRACAWLMVWAVVVYSGYSVWSSLQLAGESCTGVFHCNIQALSLSPKEDVHDDMSHFYYKIQAWLGVALVVVWGLWFLWMNYRERKAEIWTDRITVSASDFSILIEGLPTEINQMALQRILDQYHRELDPQGRLEPFQIVKFNVAEPIYVKEEQLDDSELDRLKKWRAVMREEFRRWLKARVEVGRGERFLTNDAERFQKYAQFDRLEQLIKSQVKVLTDKALAKFMEKKKQTLKNTVFVTFRFSSSQQTIVDNNKSEFARLRWCLACKGVGKSRLPIDGISIHRAPEPEDVIFANVGVPLSTIIYRKFITYFVAFTLIVAIFFGIFFLKQARRATPSSSHVTSISVSVIITIVNALMGRVIKSLTNYERNYTRIHNQRSLAIKTILSQIISMVVLTFLQNCIIERNVFGKGGLSQSVFYLALTNALLSPVMRMLDYKQAWGLMKRRYVDRPDNKLYTNQKELNEDFQGKSFDVGDQYIYPVKTLIFTSFYLSLQPVIALFSAVGIFLMYWVDKYIMLRRSKRPSPGSDIVHHTLCQFIYLCPLVFCAGALLWPWYLKSFSVDRVYPYIVGGVIGVILFLIPMEIMFDTLIPTQQDHLVYDEQRIHFSAEYDRKNPATKVQAEQEYQAFLRDLKQRVLNDPNKQPSDRQAMLDLIGQGIDTPEEQYWNAVYGGEGNDYLYEMALNDPRYQATQQSSYPIPTPYYGRQV